jgi:hypothetical protein
MNDENIDDGSQKDDDENSERKRVVERRGLLDIKMTLSNPDPTAGSEFTVYVLVTNLFDVPIWPNPPQVFLPSEMRPVSSTKSLEDTVKGLSTLFEEAAKGQTPVFDEPKSRIQRFFDTDISKIRDALRYLSNRAVLLDEDLRKVEAERSTIKQQIDSITSGKSWSEKLDLIKNDDNLKQLSSQEAEYAKRADTIREQVTNLTTQIVALTRSSAIIANGDLKINDLRASSRIYVQAAGDVEINLSAAQLVTLDSSLKPGTPLQPGNTVVYSIALAAIKKIFFRPIQYALQYSINFSFELGGIQHTNTATQQLTIRAPIVSVMSGAVVGGAAGYFATFLQNISGTSIRDILSQNWLQGVILLIVTIILSAIAVVFLARKSQTQSLVSVEDFWGGLVIGFLVGYTGTTFFENLAGISGS